ncbi:MAG: 50S ribosomal protein L25 [Treponema sp.]|nr:50S ribosomal protein L25 [Treponema sp.]
MEKMVITAAARAETGKKAAKKLREVGRIPAVVYNSKGEATWVSVDEVEFNKVWRSITATTVITLDVDGKKADALIKDTEYCIRTDKVLHADFFTPDADQLVYAKLKVHPVGTPAGVLKGGFMLRHYPEVELKATLKNMPARIEADVSKLGIGESFYVKDLGLKDVTLITDENCELVSVAPAR